VKRTIEVSEDIEERLKHLQQLFEEANKPISIEALIVDIVDDAVDVWIGNFEDDQIED